MFTEGPRRHGGDPGAVACVIGKMSLEESLEGDTRENECKAQFRGQEGHSRESGGIQQSSRREASWGVRVSPRQARPEHGVHAVLPFAFGADELVSSRRETIK